MIGRKFLDDELNPGDAERFEDHLATCEVCRSWLDEEAGGQGLVDEVRERLSSSSELAKWDDVADLHSRTRSKDACDHEDVMVASDIAILSPTDDPVSLGRIGMFEVRAIIGRGGMGTVYKAIDPSLGRTVAIKVLRPELASIVTARQRFSLEARAMATINHANVVPIFAVDEHRGLPYMAMEYVPGGTLEARLQKVGQLDVLAVIRIAHQITEALGAAHDCGLVHRDIKPANILLDRGVDRVRVADFGLVRVSDDASLTRSGVIAGTPQFMAPEQVRGEACDGRSDLFSLGCVLYNLIAGHPPFRAESPYAAMQRIVHDEPRPIREVRIDVAEWFASLIHRLLEKSADNRFESAQFVTSILEQELAHLQNPTLVPCPNRDWMESRTGHKKMLSLVGWLYFSAIGIAIVSLAVALSLWAGDHRKDRSQSQSNEEQVAASDPLKHDPSTATLWGTEDVSGIRTRSTIVQRSLIHESPPVVDSFDNDVHRLQWQLRDFERRNP